MKFLLVFGVFFLSLNAYSKTTIYSYYGTNKKDGVNYFYPNSFSKKSNFCYDGLPEEVCQEVLRSEKFVKKEYTEGTHDFFTVLSCERDHDQVTVESSLFDDYGTTDEAHTAVFGACD